MNRKTALILAKTGLVLAIIMTGIAVFSQSFVPTYHYYGEKLNTDDLVQRAEEGKLLHCVQRLTEYALINHMADDFECFDTTAEARAFSDSVSEANEKLVQDVELRIERGEIQGPAYSPPEYDRSFDGHTFRRTITGQYTLTVSMVDI